jgi:asparagine synthase (glutamine-hydrolysing)
VCKAVELTSVADVPVSVLLSGGTDSSIIAAVLRRELGAKVTGYVFGRDKDDEEVKRAREVAKLLNMPLKEYYFAAEDIKAELRALIAQNGEPFYLLPLAYASVLFRHIREDGMKVVLGGNGADELWYGYTSHPRTLLMSYLARTIGKRNNWPVKRGRLLATSVGNASAAETLRLLDGLFAQYADLMEPAKDRLYIDFSNLFALFVENAHSITFQADLAGMRNSIEVRSPFLDHKLVELAWRTPPRKKIQSLFDKSGMGNKLILKEAFKDILPHEVLFRKKMGFGFNVSEQSVFGPEGTRAYASWSLEQWRTISS